MKFKILFILILFVFGVTGAFAYTIKGGITYTVETARKEAFANVEYTLPKEIIEANRIDPNFRENKKAIKKGVYDFNDRLIQYFSDGGYVVVYKNNKYIEYYYTSDGKLDSIGKRTGLVCPIKSYKYDTNGNLRMVYLHISTKEAYIFTPDGQMKSYWIGNKGYDLNGRLIMQSY